MTFSLPQQKEDEVNNLKQETQRLNKLRETIQRKLRTVEDSKADTEQSREILKSQITALERGTLCFVHLGEWIVFVYDEVCPG